MRLPILGRFVWSIAAVGTALATALVGFPTAVLAADPSGGCATAAGVTTCTFDYTGAIEQWTVPSGVTSLTIDAYGAGGGDGGTFGVTGGKGAHVHGALAVSGGDTINVTVGGQGTTYPDGPTNAFGGGGASNYGGGGGGGSFVNDGATALVIAGGGGGAGEDGFGSISDPSDVPGGNGGDSGAPGQAGTASGTANGGLGGGAGTSSAGGTGGQEGDCPPDPADAGGDGSLGQGGNGGSYGVHTLNVTDGGGGGGGYYGGGGGGEQGDCSGDNAGAGGGGGGSSYYDPSATDAAVSNGVQSGNGLVTVAYGSQSDTTAPTVISISVELAASGKLGSAAVTLNWSASDDVTPDANLVYQTEVRREAGGTWGAWRGKRTYHGVSTANPEIPLWRTFQYRVRARDAAGNWSGWTQSNVISAFRLREQQLHLSGGWSIVSQAGATRHKVARSSTAGDTAWFSFNGDGAAFVMPVNSGQGTVQICLDPGTLGEDCATIDVGSLSPTGNKRFVDALVDLVPGNHVMKLTVVSGTVDLDGAVFTRGVNLV